MVNNTSSEEPNKSPSTSWPRKTIQKRRFNEQKNVDQPSTYEEKFSYLENNQNEYILINQKKLTTEVYGYVLCSFRCQEDGFIKVYAGIILQVLLNFESKVKYNE